MSESFSPHASDDENEDLAYNLPAEYGAALARSLSRYYPYAGNKISDLHKLVDKLNKVVRYNRKRRASGEFPKSISF